MEDGMSITLKMAVSDGDCYREDILQAEINNILGGINQFYKAPSYELAFKIGDQISWVLKDWLNVEMRDRHNERPYMIHYVNELIAVRMQFQKYVESL